MKLGEDPADSIAEIGYFIEQQQPPPALGSPVDSLD